VELPVIAWILIASVAALPAVAVLAAMADRQITWPYGTHASPSPPDLMRGAGQAARLAGLEPVEVLASAKSRLHGMRCEFFVSRERELLLVVGHGHVAGLSVDPCYVFTRLSDGRCLVTVDDPQVEEEWDLAGLRDGALFAGVPVDELVARHRERISAAAVAAVPYSSDPLADHREMLQRRIRILVENGHASWLDGGEAWRYTLKGALRSLLASVWRPGRRPARSA
jgi:hypothetical protein